MCDKFNEISQTCIDFDLNFNDNDIQMEQSLINTIELIEHLHKSNDIIINKV